MPPSPRSRRTSCTLLLLCPCRCRGGPRPDAAPVRGVDPRVERAMACFVKRRRPSDEKIKHLGPPVCDSSVEWEEAGLLASVPVVRKKGGDIEARGGEEEGGWCLEAECSEVPKDCGAIILHLKWGGAMGRELVVCPSKLNSSGVG